VADGADGKTRRAEGRQRRRAQAGGSPSQPSSERPDGGEARQAARAAATAAAVGAAVGAVRALTSRRGGEPDDLLSEADQMPAAEDALPEPADAEQQPPAGEAEQPQPSGEAEQPQPAATSEARPAHGASPDEAARIVRRAREHLRDLHGSEPESVSALERNADGWLVTLEVVELRRVPDSTDLLATYQVELDSDGGLLGFRRGGRYYRAQADGREGQS
jgi:gas vesicle protein GvpO